MRAPITSRKHVVQWTLSTVTPLATLVLEKIADGVDAGNAGVGSQVVTGSVVKAIWIELWIQSDDTSSSSFQINLEKTGGTATAMTYAQSIALDTYNNKNNVFYTTMGLVGPNDEVPTRVMYGWYKIPKGKQRLAQNEQWRLNISAITNGLTYCGQAIFKSYL